MYEIRNGVRVEMSQEDADGLTADLPSDSRINL